MSEPNETTHRSLYGQCPKCDGPLSWFPDIRFCTTCKNNLEALEREVYGGMLRTARGWLTDLEACGIESCDADRLAAKTIDQLLTGYSPNPQPIEGESEHA